MRAVYLLKGLFQRSFSRERFSGHSVTFSWPSRGALNRAAIDNIMRACNARSATALKARLILETSSA